MLSCPVNGWTLFSLEGTESQLLSYLDDIAPEWLDQVERCGAAEVPEKVRRHPHWSDLLFGLPEAVLG